MFMLLSKLQVSGKKRIVFSFLVDYFGYQINDEKLERE